MSNEFDQWPRNAREWDLVRPPLRPSPEDVGLVEDALREWGPTGRAECRVVILGVTPELATLTWPAGTSLVAIDRSEEMIRSVWPRAGLPARARVVRADWRAMPLATGTVDVAVGDGSFNCLIYPDEYRRVAAAIRRTLGPGGLCVLRMFVRPEWRETIDDIAADLWAGRITNFHAFRWRLNMAVQPSTERGVRFGETWNVWHAICPDPAVLLRDVGFSEAEIRTIDKYRDSSTHFTFPTLDETRRALSADFVELACRTPSYEIGDRCPTMVFRAR